MDAQFRHDLAKDKRDVPVDRTQFTAALRRILFEFRTHKKNEPGKYAKRIGYVVASGSPVKRTVLSFLIETGVIRLEMQKYIIDKDAMKKMQLSVHLLARLDESNADKAYVSYCAWRNKK